jgi:hypothetical protein
MVVVLVIASVWLLLALATYCVLWVKNQRPLNETDRLCNEIDLALRAQYGERPGRFVREAPQHEARTFALRR